MNLIFLLRISKTISVLSILGRKNLKLFICQNFKKRKMRLNLKWRVLQLIIYCKAKNQVMFLILDKLKREKKKLNWRK